MVRKRVFCPSPSTRAARAVLAMTTTTVLAAALVLPSVAAAVDDDPRPPLESDDLHISLPLLPRPRRLGGSSYGKKSKSKKSKSSKSSKSGSKCSEDMPQSDDICDVPSSTSKTSKSKSQTLYPTPYIIPVVIECDVTDDVIEGELTDAFAESFGCVYNALACDKRNSRYYSQVDVDSVDVDLVVVGDNCEETTTTTTSQQVGRELRRRTTDAYISSNVGSGSCDTGCEDEGADLVDEGLRRVLQRELGGCQGNDQCKSLPARSEFETEVVSRVRQTTGIGVYQPEFETDVCDLDSPGAPDPDSETTYENQPWTIIVDLDCDEDVEDFRTQLGCALERTYNEKACNDRDSEFFSQILITGITGLREDDAACVRRDLQLEVSDQGERKLGRRKRRVVLDADAEVASGSCDSSCEDEGAPLFEEGMRRRRDLQANTDRCAMLPNKEEVDREAINEVSTVNDIDAELITCSSTDGTYDYEFNFALQLDCTDLVPEKLAALEEVFACTFVEEYNAEACDTVDTGWYSQLVGGVITTFEIDAALCNAPQGGGIFTIQGKVTGTTGLDSEFCDSDVNCPPTIELFSGAGAGSRCTELPAIGVVEGTISVALKNQIDFELIQFVSLPVATTTPPTRIVI